MKKIISIALLSFIYTFTYAQSSPETTSIVKEKTFISNKVKGEFNFQMPEGTSAEKIAETAQYYTKYFDVKYDSITRIAHITLTHEKSGGVIMRFLISNDIRTILYDGKEYDTEKFVANFIQ